MGVGTGLYVYDVVVKSSRSLSYLLTSFLFVHLIYLLRCLRDRTLNRFSITPTCDRQTDTRLRHIPR